MNDTSFLVQTHVYFKKIFRIAMREKAWKYMIFAAIISFIVSTITGGDMFKNYDSTNSGFFTLSSACIWIGIFNSIQSICKEHEIIRAEYRQGMKISAYIFANIQWQALLCLVQSVIIFGISCIFMDFSKSEYLIVSPYVENFITVYLLVFGAAVLGIMVSSLSGTPTTAMTIMPFVLIIQLIMCGVLFKLEGFADGISYITLSKWGMSAFGSVADLNSFDIVIGDSDLVVHAIHKDSYDHEVSRLLLAWIWIFGITVFNAVVSIIALKVKNRDS